MLPLSLVSTSLLQTLKYLIMHHKDFILTTFIIKHHCLSVLIIETISVACQSSPLHEKLVCPRVCQNRPARDGKITYYMV